MSYWSDLFGTSNSSFSVGMGSLRATLTSALLTAARTLALPDASGTLALTTDLSNVGIGVITSAPISTDLDDAALVSGLYNVAAAVTGNPAALNGVVLHRIAGTTGFQLFSTTQSSTRLFWRRRVGSVWSAWNEVASLDAANVAFTGGSITGITDLALADGGTGASTDAGARTNLGIDALGLGITGNNLLADFDDATVLSGIYSITAGTIGTLPMAAAAGVCIHRMTVASSGGMQIFLANGSERMFWRTRTGSAWLAWKEVGNLADLALLAGAAFTGAVSFASTVTAAAVGPTSARQHTLPNVASSEVLIASTTQTIGGRKVFSLTPVNVVTQTSKAGAAVLTGAEVLTGSILYTGAAAALTLPTGTLMESELNSALGGVPPVGAAFDVVFTNTGAGTLTITAGANFTIQGVNTLATTTGQRFLARKTALNTFVLQRG